MQQQQLYPMPAVYQPMAVPGPPSTYYPSMPTPMGMQQPYYPAASMYPQYQQYPAVNTVPYAAPPPRQQVAAVLPFQQQLNAYSNKTSHAQAAGTAKKPANPPPVAAPAPAGEWYCEPCDKEFTQLIAYDAHMGTHESCKHPGCSFSATRKVVVAHFHGAHGQFSGSGYKMIDVEGQKFRVLLGQSPEEIAQWRAERRKKFPTAEQTDAKKAELDELIAAGGIEPKLNKFGKKERDNSNKTTTKKRPLDGDTATSGPSKVQKVPKVGENGEEIVEDEQGEDVDDAVEAAGAGGTPERKCFQFGRGRCRNGDKCTFSHAFEPLVCEHFVRGFCKRGFKCFNIHDNQARLANKETRMALKNNKSKSVGGEEGTPTDVTGSPTPASNISASKDANKRNKADKPQDKEKKKRPGELYLPPPLDGGERGTLWKKLLEDEIQREENVVLQCLRFLVQNNYLDTA